MTSFKQSVLQIAPMEIVNLLNGVKSLSNDESD